MGPAVAAAGALTLAHLLALVEKEPVLADCDHARHRVSGSLHGSAALSVTQLSGAVQGLPCACRLWSARCEGFWRLQWCAGALGVGLLGGKPQCRSLAQQPCMRACFGYVLVKFSSNFCIYLLMDFGSAIALAGNYILLC